LILKNNNNNVKNNKLTTGSPRPFSENKDSMPVVPTGLILLQDYYLHEKLAHFFNRERIPELVVHDKDTGAYGIFKATKNISNYTGALCGAT